MPKYYSKRFKKLLPTIAGIASYIETNAGGFVFPSDDKESNAVNFKWKKGNPNTMEMMQYNHKVTYLELESTIDAVVIAKSIVDKIKKGEEQ